MTLHATQTGLDDYANTFIRLRAVKLKEMLNLSRSDIDDLRQDLTVYLIERLHLYDPKKSTRKGFVAMVLNNRIRTIIRLHRESMEALKRDTLSLEEEFSDTDNQPIQRFETIDEEAALMNAGVIRRRALEYVEMSVDVAAFLEKLPERLRDLCLLLCEKPIAQVARDTGLSRQKIHEELVRMRLLAEESGLREYL